MNWLHRISNQRPLVECLTNFVTANDVANSLLAIGASPVMGVEPEELSELISKASAVLLNIGTARASETTVFDLAIAAAKELRKPVILDPVGAGATAFRTELAKHLLSSGNITAIRGNASEIRSLLDNSAATKGVDVADSDIISPLNLQLHLARAQAAATKYQCLVSVSGPIDIIADGCQAMLCRNGVPELCQVTGTGCSLTGLSAAFLAVAQPEEYLEALAWATALMGVAGEIAREKLADSSCLGSFHWKLRDALAALDDQKLAARARLETMRGE